MSHLDIDLDFQRQERIGLPEIIYGAGKLPEQLVEIARLHEERGLNLLVTRCLPEQVAGLDGIYEPVSRTFRMIRTLPDPLPGRVAFVYGGSSDLPVVRESLITLEFLGGTATECGDCGVAGLHRLLAHRKTLDGCQVVICFAGFECALPSVVGGLFPQPVIAVPTSVGYGVSEGGRAALHAALSSCASGVTVMNIDNGCGAAAAAARILRQLNGTSHAVVAG
ncbi:nickel pincer cofactor biosynthesis protein LarB [Thioalkalivibrio sp. XN8]|uniref:nickel pincer cofactor biosynthesis protein LarB n=1 Tax=Thioalkalivibrio sp. XN8 TaxID=2712863 RepID=UPI0013EAA617|nr:nickel pincer cofactor biosynthesis protein LarB [Thioalkalivibrio sp. XN8]NGP53701.1 nickel pincer cofactor biosynthesis protein LarB [Thioalkalivibrio sp. XN8]